MEHTQEPVVVKLRWFAFHQNNSGGDFVVDENVSEFVFIQAIDAAHAAARAEELLDNSDSCPCCGDRWSFYIDDRDGTDTPEIYGDPIQAYKSHWIKDFARLHFYDGRIQTFPSTNALESK